MNDVNDHFRVDEKPDFLVEGEREITGSARVAIRPNWNADGRSILFEVKDGATSTLFSIDAGGGRATALDLCNQGATRVQGRPAFFGQDDFAFVSDRSGSLAIWRCDLRRQAVDQLTWPGEGESDYGPAAPGSDPAQFLFFRAKKPSETPRVHLGRVGTVDAPLLLTPGMSNQPWLVPGDDSFIFHSGGPEASGVFRQPLAPEAHAQRIGPLDTGTSYVTPYPSPDGRHVAFANRIAGVSQICVMRLDGSHQQQLTFGSVPSMFPAWSPTGERLVLVRGDPTADTPEGRLVVLSLVRVSV